MVELAAKLLRVIWGVWRSGRPYDPARALPAGASPRPAGRPRPAARGPRRAPRRPRAGVRVTLGQGADGRVRFAFREADDPAGDRRR
jgi:hypothetical protein